MINDNNIDERKQKIYCSKEALIKCNKQYILNLGVLYAVTNTWRRKRIFNVRSFKG